MNNMKQSLNNVFIDGVLNEIDLKAGEKDGRNYIAGKLIMLVEQVVSEKSELEEIPVSVFAYDKTNAGKDSSSYKSLRNIMETGVSVAACGSEEEADKYAISGGSIGLNKFPKDGKLIVYPQIRGNFFNKINKQFLPRATFEQTVLFKECYAEVVDEAETGRLIVKGILVQYNGTPDEMTYVVESPSAIDYIKGYYTKGDTIKISGVIRYTVTVEQQESEGEVGFGEPQTHEVKKTTREFIITSGSSGGLEGDAAFDVDQVIDALENEKIREKKLLEGENKGASKPADRGF